MERPRLDEDTLRSIIDPDGVAPAAETFSTARVQALVAWKQALMRRDELRQLVEEREGVKLDVEKLSLARSVAPVGLRVPYFPYYGRIGRVLARLAARSVMFFAGPITVHQRAFNAALLDLVTECAAEIARLEARMLKWELRLADADCDLAWQQLADTVLRDRLDAGEREG
jgi:hypothetical protein